MAENGGRAAESFESCAVCGLSTTKHCSSCKMVMYWYYNEIRKRQRPSSRLDLTNLGLKRSFSKMMSRAILFRNSLLLLPFFRCVQSYGDTYMTFLCTYGNVIAGKVASHTMDDGAPLSEQDDISSSSHCTRASDKITSEMRWAFQLCNLRRRTRRPMLMASHFSHSKLKDIGDGATTGSGQLGGGRKFWFGCSVGEVFAKNGDESAFG
ncbi:Coatomer subunit zeta-1 [Castilleja foliolosa]|uniref:Coatomer subunit zeta-1 n=1 Tax=Castilleja foliolosa TaxID=1961234 RepID=A0ABD3EBH7_9LAMI